MNRPSALPYFDKTVINFQAAPVIGAGFAGLTAVRTLDGSGLDVTLVDRNPYSTFQPLLYEVATAGLSPSDVAYPLRALARRTKLPMTGSHPAAHPRPFAGHGREVVFWLIVPVWRNT